MSNKSNKSNSNNILRALIKEEIKKALKEADNDGYNNYAKALKLYKEKGNDQKYDISLTDLFDGSKITSRFIYRSISQPSSANYKKDCMEFGKDAFDDLIIPIDNFLSAIT